MMNNGEIGFVKVKKEAEASHDDADRNKSKSKDCSWCAESQHELQQTVKDIQRLHARKIELEQDMDCCDCSRKHNNEHEQTKQRDDADIIIPTSSIPIISIKLEQVEEDEEEIQSNNTNDLKSKADDLPQSLDNMKEEYETPAGQIVNLEPPMSEGEEEASDLGPISNPAPSTDFTYKCMKQFKCEAASSSLSEMTKHLAEVHGWETYAPFCEICGLLFMKTRAMKNHRKSKHTFTCEICNQVYPNYGTYIYHKRHDHERIPTPTTPCSECGQLFSIKLQLIKHILNAHGTSTPDGKQLLWPCAYCKSSMFLNEQERDVHERNQHNQECKTCGDVFASFEAVTQHRINVHGYVPPTPPTNNKRKLERTKLEDSSDGHNDDDAGGEGGEATKNKIKRSQRNCKIRHKVKTLKLH